jgi:hypothetical protein
VEHLSGLDNVWFEVVQYPSGQGTAWDFNAIAQKVGRDRMIFGADLPYYDFRVLQRTIEEADIDEDLKDRIAYKNIIPLIQKYNPGWQLPDAPPTSPGRYEPPELWAANPENPVRLTVYA